MSMSIQVDQQEPLEFASLGGMRALRRSIVAEKYPNLAHLVTYGWENDVLELAKEVESLADEVVDDDVEGSLRAMLPALKRGGQVASITNGITA